MSRDGALYIHVPFCRRKCRYCSFVSFPGREADIPRYADALKKELRARTQNQHVGSVYFGGGTPSLLPPDAIENLLAEIRRLFTLDTSAEITMEANPGTVDLAYLKAVRHTGVNRLSLGAQSFTDAELALLGRIHTAAEAKKAFRLARNAGFNNVNLDLIYGLPGQTLEAWRHSLEEALLLQPDHLSLYALTLETEAPMQGDIDSGSLPAIDPDLSADQYGLAEKILEEKGYLHYEISNWALRGKECRHNLVYWQNLPYLGVGVAAHSCLDGHRTANTNSLEEYLAAFSGDAPYRPAMDEVISPELELAETVILGLRLGKGVNVEAVRNRYGVDIAARFPKQIADMSAAGLLVQAGPNITLTPRGRLLSNEVFWRFLPE